MSRLKLQQICKYYGATTALASGDLQLERGEIHVLIGANGSGKSTLCKVIAGSVRPDGGLFELNGQKVSLFGPQAAREQGICLFYQELSLANSLTIAQNISLYRLPTKAGGLIDDATLAQRAEHYIDKFKSVTGENFSADMPVAKLRPDQKQLVEIMKTLASEAEILIFDEPTSALDRAQVDCFFSILRELREEGRSIIFISHRMDEIFDIADRITVIRDGATVSSRQVCETDQARIIRDMIGEPPEAQGQTQTQTQGAGQAQGLAQSQAHATDHQNRAEICLTAEALTGNQIRNVSFTLAKGEILGLGGLHGQGQSTLLRSLFGAEKLLTGSLTLNGSTIHPSHPRSAIKSGFSYVSGDRVRDGVITDRSIMENVSPIHFLKDHKFLAFPGPLSRIIEPALAILNTKYSSLGASISSLSGGNQQKVVIARWLTNPPDILLLDDPTKGIDLSAKRELFALVRKLADEGMAIILYSSEDGELLAHSDRILVFNNGSVSRELTGKDKTRFNLYEAAYSGAK
ncbi:sugar ABC transporter ATP-binding protein [uncultured Cohaesibacter sp.]|uniref:sugar ABC transporter ATP-binding protein n=1 Tax=uncultured Cohaesibacter sp. TaxID=1002546 RepID=UPI0029C8D7A1|nr:sugar ABC transporter ATP-binding protein [uncultured Cohaesibacter sp.]